MSESIGSQFHADESQLTFHGYAPVSVVQVCGRPAQSSLHRIRRRAYFCQLACACGGAPKPALNDLPPLPGDPPRVEPQATTGCIPSGSYRVTVDLADAKITQGNTGMADTAWCKSMLVAVPAQMMATMRIAVDDGAIGLEWPVGHAATATLTGCDVEITSPPIAAKLTFADGKGTGMTTYTTGTQHEGDTCTATNAKLTVELLR